MDFSDTSSTKKFCIFCGNIPEQKNKEHVLPQWLIKLTGDPKRTVDFGRNPITGKVPRFDWSSFTFPACTKCNEKFSVLEGKVKPIVQSLIARQPISSIEYVDLLDWLDKVRIGLWLGYSYLHKNPAQITPRFHINSRMAKKDRMVAVYTFDTENIGLNTYGAETLSFQFKPSCFLLRINSIALLNISYDFFCAPRCGFPFPNSAIVDAASGYVELSNYSISRKVKHPLTRQRIIKPSIHIFQPILACPSDIIDTNEEWLRPKLINDGIEGVLFHQLPDRVEVLTNLDAPIVNGTVKGIDSRPLKDIIAQTYDLQFASIKSSGAPWDVIDNASHMKHLLRVLKADTGNYVKAFSGLGLK